MAYRDLRPNSLLIFGFLDAKNLKGHMMQMLNIKAVRILKPISLPLKGIPGLKFS